MCSIVQHILNKTTAKWHLKTEQAMIFFFFMSVRQSLPVHSKWLFVVLVQSCNVDQTYCHLVWQARLSNDQQSKQVRIVFREKKHNLELGKSKHTLSSSPSISTFPLSLSRPAACLCADSTSDISTTGSFAVAKTWAEQQCRNVLTPLCCL